MVDPQDIERVSFSATRLKEGYDQDQVDNFLDRVADSLRAALDGKHKAEAEVISLRRKVAELERAAHARSQAETSVLPVVHDAAPAAPSEAAARLLELAQRTADDVQAQALRQAEEAVAKAQRDAMGITARADEIAREVVNEATSEADQRRRKAEDEARKAEQHLERLAETRRTVRAHLEAQLNDLRNKLGDPQ